MKLIMSTIISILLFTTLASSILDIDFTSVIRKLQSIDITKSTPDDVHSLPMDVLLFISFFNRDCVVQKLGFNVVDESQIFDIPNLKEFMELSTTNLKILVAIEYAAKLCTRNSKTSKDVGLFQMVQLRSFLTKLIFPDTRLNPERAVQCFKWYLSQIKPNSPVLDGFDVSTLKYTVDQCKDTTSIEEYSKILEKRRQKLNIRSCDLETFGQPRNTADSIIENFLFFRLSTPQIVQNEAVINEGAINTEANVLEGQLNCIMKDLKDE